MSNLQFAIDYALTSSSDFPVVVVAFQATSPEMQREQFILVNKTKPLPRDLLNEFATVAPDWNPGGT